MGGRTSKNLTLDDRRLLEKALYTYKLTIKEIAILLNRHVSCIYREIKKGKTIQSDTHLNTYYKYTADIGEKIHRANMKKCGSKEKKILDIHKEFLYKKMRIEKYSPYASIKKAYEIFTFKDFICYNTIYRRIKKNRFYDLKMSMLPYGIKNKNRFKEERKQAPYGKSIEQRDIEILSRNTFGHWEMDSVMGNVNKSKNNLITLIERKTRFQFIFKVNTHKAIEVEKIINYLERILKSNFSLIFKTITCDNGVEFASASGIEKSKLYKNVKRTQIYYCHPYVPQERGSNENCHKLIRRFIPSGTDFDYKDNADILYIQNYINDYPRKILKGISSEYMFKQELKKLNISTRYLNILKHHVLLK